MNALLIADRFSSQSMTSMIIIALICTAIPFIFLGYYRAKTDAKISSFFIGMAFYVLFAFVAEGFINYLLFNVLSLKDFFTRSSHPVWYAIYGAVMAGVFEEVGKYVGLRRFMESRPGKSNAFLFGVGHGGFEIIAYGSSLFMGNIILGFMINSVGLEEYLAKLNLAGEELTSYRDAIQTLIAVPPIENVVAGTERLLALVLQAALAVLIYIALQDKKRKFLFPAAILLHIVGLLPTYLTQVGIIQNIALTLSLTGGLVVVIAAYAYRSFHSLDDKESPAKQ